MSARASSPSPNRPVGGLYTPITSYGRVEILISRPTGSRFEPNSLSASLRFTTTTRALAASSRSLKERPGHTSPPATLGQSASRPEMFTAETFLPENSTSADPFSSRTTKRIVGSSSRRVGSLLVIGGGRRPRRPGAGGPPPAAPPHPPPPT